MAEMRRAQILLTPPQYRYLQERAECQDSNISAIVRELVQAEMEGGAWRNLEIVQEKV